MSHFVEKTIVQDPVEGVLYIQKDGDYMAFVAEVFAYGVDEID